MDTTTTANTTALASALGKPEILDVEGVPHIALPPDWTSESAESLLDEPRRIRAAIIAHEVSGLTSYVTRFKTFRTALYCGPRDRPQVLARVDDNQADENPDGRGLPSHVTHTCTFGCPTTVEWKAWTGSDKRSMAQVEFAEFIEKNLRDIVEPSGGDFLAAVLSFQDTGSAEFRSAVRLSDGRVQFQLTQKDDASQIKFPLQLKLGLPVFEGMPGRYEVLARLRYRIKEEKLSLWYEIDRPDLVVRQAYADLLTFVEKETGLQVHRAL